MVKRNSANSVNSANSANSATQSKMKNGSSNNKTQSFYDRVADVHNLAMKINGYRDSVAKYLRSLKLNLDAESTVLDAGCGTGLATLALYKAGYHPRKTFALDLSFNSLTIAREQFGKDENVAAQTVEEVQGNLLSLPFANETHDAILTCGALEYVPLDKGLSELARVLKPGGKLILIPVRPSVVGSVLEFLYNFKTHPIEEVKETARHYFKIVGNHKFPSTEPISWSKTIFLLEKSGKAEKIDNRRSKTFSL
ncbi:MAG: class I SAM-dependent methyltransferase [Pyrinomonadaceae bacterium]